MSKKAKIAIIVEGIKQEPKIIANIIKNFINKEEVELITLPACTNIYALSRKMKKDSDKGIIETIIELLSSYDTPAAHSTLLQLEQYSEFDFSQVYLFFDYDGHSTNLPRHENVNDVLSTMLDLFDNETENGKLYISYPMVEALQHYSKKSPCYDLCLFDICKGTSYKKTVRDISKILDISQISEQDWQFILYNFLIRVSCLFDKERSLDMEQYKKEISNSLIFQKELEKYILPYGKVMIISAIPEFIVEYFKTDILNTYLEANSAYKKNIEYKQDCTRELVV